MKAKRADFVLSDEDIIKITRIILDNDTEGALGFLADRISGNTLHSENKRSGMIKRCDIVIEERFLDDLSTRLKNRDALGCLSFLKDHFEKEIKTALIPHCVPVFEASYKPSQAGGYATGDAAGKTGR